MFPALRRQSNPNWLALFFRVDSHPSEDQLSSVLRKFSDARLEEVRLSGNASVSFTIGFRAYCPVPRISVNVVRTVLLFSSVQYTTTDAGYSRTDEVLRQALRRTECQYVTITTSDNAYGSEVTPLLL
jgi:hypothetical protein